MSGISDITAPKLWIVLARCQRSMTLLVERWVAEEGLSVSDFQLLERCCTKARSPSPRSRKKMLLATGSMTAAVDRVERKGLIQRTAAEADRRARRLVLTEQGRELAQSLYQRHARQLDVALSVLDDADKIELYRLLKKLGLFAADMLDLSRFKIYGDIAEPASHDRRRYNINQAAPGVDMRNFPSTRSSSCF